MAEIALLALLAAPAFAQEGLPARTAVVTFDNGEFNAPLDAPRWNGRWRRPSLAQEVATTVARVLGENPRVYTYMPAGRTAGRPGDLYEVRPVRPDCSGPAEKPGDACWCSPADNCWSGLQGNYHPAGSTSLVRTVAALREAVSEGDAPRVEIHVTDFFEEDPSAAADPADSDRCVTAQGVRRAVSGVLMVGEGESVDHLAVGVLRGRVDPPPPGGTWGFTYELVPADGLDPASATDGTCWSGALGRPWSPGVAPLSMAMGIVVIGVGTEALDDEVRQLMEALQAQLSGDGKQLDLVPLVAPSPSRSIATTLTHLDADPFRVGPLPEPNLVPCDRVTATAEVSSPMGRLQLADVQGRCDGEAGISFEPGELRRHFVGFAGMNSGIDDLVLEGHIDLVGDQEAVRRRLAVLAPSDVERGLPLWPAVIDALDPARNEAGPVRPWRARVDVPALTVTGLDGRPWLLAVLAAAMAGLLGGLFTSHGLRQLQAARAMRNHYEASVTSPLRQRPLSLVLAEAQQDVARAWPARAAAGVAMGLVLLSGTFVTVMLLYRVMRG